jgi:hypothetical protein
LCDSGLWSFLDFGFQDIDIMKKAFGFSTPGRHELFAFIIYDNVTIILHGHLGFFDKF